MIEGVACGRTWKKTLVAVCLEGLKNLRKKSLRKIINQDKARTEYHPNVILHRSSNTNLHI
jgi:hypothetical protein